MAMTTARAPSRAPRRAPDRSPAPKSRLAVVNARRLAERGQRRRARTMALLAAAFVVVGLLVVVTGQALVASQQLHLDNLQSQLANATAANENLDLQRAQLTSPAAVLQIAEQKLHMVAPSTVQYLAPAVTGPSVAEAAAGKK